MAQPLLFDLDFSSARSRSERMHVGRRRLALQRSVLAWLQREDPPTGAALRVITRISRLRADAAAFWSRPVRNPHDTGPTQVLEPVRTAIFQCHVERDDCWPDCAKSGTILPQLRALKQELVAVERHIRSEEPNLRRTDTLFEEYAEWRYDDSANRDYPRLRHTIEKMEHSLYHGTMFERIRSAQLADRLYLVVPAGVVNADELADGWGLLWVHDDFRVQVISEAENRECLSSNRLHLIQNIAAAAKQAVLFQSGVRELDDRVLLVQRPRSHRRPESRRLRDF